MSLFDGNAPRLWGTGKNKIPLRPGRVSLSIHTSKEVSISLSQVFEDSNALPVRQLEEAVWTAFDHPGTTGSKNTSEWSSPPTPFRPTWLAWAVPDRPCSCYGTLIDSTASPPYTSINPYDNVNRLSSTVEQIDVSLAYRFSMRHLGYAPSDWEI